VPRAITDEKRRAAVESVGLHNELKSKIVIASQAVMTPFIGSAGNALNRIVLTSLGTAIWGATSAGIASAQNFEQVMDAYPLSTSAAGPMRLAC
jgi:hypothetical protein